MKDILSRQTWQKRNCCQLLRSCFVGSCHVWCLKTSFKKALALQFVLTWRAYFGWVLWFQRKYLAHVSSSQKSLCSSHLSTFRAVLFILVIFGYLWEYSFSQRIGTIDRNRKLRKTWCCFKNGIKLKIGTGTPAVDQTGVPFRRQSTVLWCSKTFSLLTKFHLNSVRTSPY